MAERNNLTRESRPHRNSPLLNSSRKYLASEKSSLSGSYEAPKSYGATRKPLQPPCDFKLIGHVVEASDTLQGLAIKYGVTVCIFTVFIFRYRMSMSWFNTVSLCPLRYPAILFYIFKIAYLKMRLEYNCTFDVLWFGVKKYRYALTERGHSLIRKLRLCNFPNILPGFSSELCVVIFHFVLNSIFRSSPFIACITQSV